MVAKKEARYDDPKGEAEIKREGRMTRGQLTMNGSSEKKMKRRRKESQMN